MKQFIPLIWAAGVLFASCSKEKFEHVTATPDSEFPKQLVIDEEKVGELEDSDKVKFEVKLTDAVDPTGESLSGKPAPLKQAVSVSFELKDAEGFANWSDYVTGGTAYYEIDDCTTSEDLNIDLNYTFDAATGQGAFIFPEGATSVIIELELNASLMDDVIENTDNRGFTFALTGIGSSSETVVLNTDLVAEFRVYDDEKVFGDWSIDYNDATQYNRLLELFTMANSELDGLSAVEVDGVDVSFAFDEFKLVFTLTATEEVDNCGSVEQVNIEIAVEGEIDDLTDDATSGEINFVAERENANETISEIEYAGTFERVGSTLTLTLKGADGNDETEELVLTLSK